MNKKYGIVASISLLVFAAAAVTAAPPTSYYSPLETNDPTCAPGDLNCDVELNFLTTEVDGDITNEIQDLSLSGSTLSLSGSAGAPIDLSGLSGMDTDDQTLSLSGVTLSIVDGNDTDLSPAITSLQPWFGTDDNAGATLNTEDIYTMGNVGIGTDEPQWPLEVRTGAGVNSVIDVDSPTGLESQLLFSEQDVRKFKIGYSPVQSRLNFHSYVNGSINMVIEDTGNVGIGTTAPSERLVVGDDLGNLTSSSESLVIGDDTNPARLYLGSDINNFVSLLWDNTNNYLGFDTKANGTTYSRTMVLKDGNVGIGTTVPTETLDVDGTARVRTLGTGTGSDSIVTADSTGVLRQLPISSISGMGSPWFGTDDNAGATLNTEDMYTMGNIGIGTDTIVAGLDIRNTSSVGRGLLLTQNKASISNNAYTLEVDSSAHNTNMTTAGAMAVDVASGRAFTINGLGNVGIGKSNPATKLDLADGTNDISIRFSTIAGSVSTRSLITAEAATGKINFISDFASNAAGSGFQFTDGPNDLLTILNNGNVGIGTTSPDSQLSIVGLPSGTTDAVTPGALAGAVCITDAGNMYIDTDGTCAN